MSSCVQTPALSSINRNSKLTEYPTKQRVIHGPERWKSSQHCPVCAWNLKLNTITYKLTNVVWDSWNPNNFNYYPWLPWIFDATSMNVCLILAGGGGDRPTAADCQSSLWRIACPVEWWHVNTGHIGRVPFSSFVVVVLAVLHFPPPTGGS